MPPRPPGRTTRALALYLALFFFLGAFALAAPETPQPPVHHLVQIFIGDAADLERVLALELDLVRERTLELPVRALEAVVSDADLARIEAAGFEWEVLVEDLRGFYARRLAAASVPLGPSSPFGTGSMGGYQTLAEVLTLMDDLHRGFPAIVSARWSIGKSHQGRDIWAQKISYDVNVTRSEPEVLFDALQHAREPMGMELTLALMFWLTENYGKERLATYLVDERQMFFVPVANPDGYEYNRSLAPGGGGMWRKNRRDNGGGVFGVDLNRNWPYQWGGAGSSTNPRSDIYRGPSAASEPEVQALTAFIQARRFTLGFSSHTYSDLLLRPWGYAALDPPNAANYDMIGELATRVNQVPHGACGKILYVASGGSFDSYHEIHGMYGFSPEIGSAADGFWPPRSRIVPLIEENLWMFQAMALCAGEALHAEVTAVREVVGNGNGFFEPGETIGVELTLFNSGIQAAHRPVIADLTRLPTGARVLNGRHDFGAPAAFSRTDNASSLLTFELPPGASGSQRVEITLQGVALEAVLSFQLPIGRFRLLALEDSEEDLGWTLGLPTDTARTGQWTRMPPQQTVSGGRIIQPGSDTSPPPGTHCFVTDGRAGSSAGTYDVDDGFTTLLSPVLDLSHVSLLRVGYQRWFVDTGNTERFRICVSDDGGKQWAPLEVVAPQPSAWIEASNDLPTGMAPTAKMRLRFVAEDSIANPSLVEACIDDLELWGVVDGPSLVAFSSGQGGKRLRLCSSAEPGQAGVLLAAAGPGSQALPGFGGALLLESATLFPFGLLLHDPEGYASASLPIPTEPSLKGARVFFQSVVLRGGGAANGFSNRQVVEVF